MSKRSLPPPPITRAGSTAKSSPTFTETVTGYVNGDTGSIVSGMALTGSSTATATTGVGGYTITGSTTGLGVNDGNYTFASANGTLTINKCI